MIIIPYRTPKISEITIDTDKNWAGKKISNVAEIKTPELGAYGVESKIYPIFLHHASTGATLRESEIGIEMQFVPELSRGAKIGAIIESVYANAVGLIFQTYNTTDGLREVMRIRGDGNIAPSGNLVMGADKTVDGVDISVHAANVNAHHPPGIMFNLGLATLGIKQAQALIPGALTISKVKIYSDVAPTGASLIVDVNKNGTSIFTTQANRPTIIVGEHFADSGSPDITSLAEGDRLSVDIDQIGSVIVGGDDLLIAIIFE